AGFLSGFTGYSQMSDFATSDGIVNFAVYQNNGTTQNWATDLSGGGNPTIVTPLLPGGGIPDTTAAYVYFYQVVNNNPVPPDSNLSAFYVSLGVSTPYTSAGYLSATVFSDASGAVGPAGNQFLGPEPTGTVPDDVVNGVPSQSGVTGVGFTTLAS